MIPELEALHAVARTGSVTRAATGLRLTQGAVSKRLAALEDRVGIPLLERAQRGVALTAEGKALVDRTGPLLAELRDALDDPSLAPAGPRTLRLAVSESILASWGPAALDRVRRRLPHLTLELATHRSPVALDHVRSGEYHLALVAGDIPGPGLEGEVLAEEPLVVVPSRLERLSFRGRRELEVITIEEASATGRILARRLPDLSMAVHVTARLQSFTAVVQLARTGFGHGLAPLGVARALGVSAKRIARLPRPGLTRPVSLVGRRGVFRRDDLERFRELLRGEAGRATDRA